MREQLEKAKRGAQDKVLAVASRLREALHVPGPLELARDALEAQQKWFEVQIAHGTGNGLVLCQIEELGWELHSASHVADVSSLGTGEDQTISTVLVGIYLFRNQHFA